MKLQIGCVMVLCLACGKGESEKSALAAPSAPAEQTAPAQAAPSANKPAEPDPEAQAIASLKADPVGKVKAYVVYHQRWLDVLKQFGARSKEYQAKEKAGQFEGVTGAVRTALQLSSMGKEQRDAMEKALSDSKLSDKEVSALGELLANAQMQEHMQKGAAEMNSAKTAAQFAKLEQLVQAAPADQREAMQKQLDEMKQTQVKVREAASMKDMRAKYGDAAVDAMLAALPELKAQLRQFSADTK